MGSVRQRMVEGALRLLARRGLQATSFAEVLELTDSPRGSVYHHFPGGKDEMVAAAIALADEHATALLEKNAGEPATKITADFLRMWRTVLTRSRNRAGCAVVAVTVATDSDELITQAGTIFRTWRDRMAVLLEQGGLTTTDAKSFAATLIAASEGAVVLCRAERSIEPFDLMADQMTTLATTLTTQNQP
ncbi:TetR/AcrR family transcriptional regulator [Umezawaea sp. Da 62-37]|uniref:TetR/AcrR family transcriptional regulator n=1 Tax=Umezawaea sp. Da 62-37 TaxID=3075927 RepID=UPI0028F735A1|nr:TetR/AcrR family transcriptional regulator [Umezawaea sp. Da 62-37]WNV84407.1 TetR/AcrR family transcriptional regulator [Umezawaea sp. Da 62-37]